MAKKQYPALLLNMKLVGINNSFEHSKVLGDKTVLQKVLLEIQKRELNKSTRAQGPPVQLQLNFRTVIQQLKQEE